MRKGQCEANGAFIWNLIVAGMLVSVIGMFSAAPLAIFFVWYRWWTVLLGFGVYAFEVVALYKAYTFLARRHHVNLPALTAEIKWRTIGLAVMAVALIVLLALGNDWLTHWLHLPAAENQTLIDQLDKQHPIALMIGACVFGPLCEELTFRGIFAADTVFGKQQRPPFIVIVLVISSVLFGLVHTGFENFVQFSYYTLFGLIVGSTYWLSGRDIRVNAAVHMLSNLIIALI